MEIKNSYKWSDSLVSISYNSVPNSDLIVGRNFLGFDVMVGLELDTKSSHTLSRSSLYFYLWHFDQLQVFLRQMLGCEPWRKGKKNGCDFLHIHFFQ